MTAEACPRAVPLILAVCFCAIGVVEGRIDRRERNER